MGTGELAVGRRWTFGPAVLDERTLELTVGGEPARIERKPLEVLLYLLHHAGEVVTKDELADNLWPGRILTETVLTRCISQLRQVLKDDDRSVIRTVHGYGYRLVAEVKVDAITSPTPPAFSFKAGEHPPLRPHWRLVERLGTGGHGEAWLAQQEKTRDARVFKFALDAAGLAALKREITLYRLLNDTLGDRAPAVRLLEWNLEEAPYFIETEYVEGRDLSAWAAAHGGLAAMPLERRLDLVAQIAEALAAAHSVGVLHKDVKPGNVLVQDTSDGPKVKLCDFGSGGVLDAERLEKLGITRLGFTKTAATATSATPLYVAPEVIAGQPSTVAADIYALGVLLYQLAVGDFRKALAPGWELDVADELLREDIAAAAAGDPSRRLAEAAQLAERLRSLESRRQVRVAAVAARQRAERAQRVQTELRRTRAYALLLLGVAAIAVAGGITAYKARNAALEATATAKAISGFLMEDVFHVDSGVFRPSEASYESLLKRAADQAGMRLRDEPEAAADVHWMLGRRYQEIGHFALAAEQYELAVSLFTTLHGEADDRTLMALDRLALVHIETGRWSEAIAMSEHVLSRWQSRLQPTDPAMLMIRIRHARIVLSTGDYVRAENALRAVINESKGAQPNSILAPALLKQWLGIELPGEAAADVVAAYANLLLAANVLEETGDGYAEPISRLLSALAVFSKVLGDESELSALTRFGLAMVLTSKGEFTEAERFAVLANKFFDKSLPEGHFARILPMMAVARLRAEQFRFAEALRVMDAAMQLCPQDNTPCPIRLHAEVLWVLGRISVEAGRVTSGIRALRTCLEISENRSGPDHAFTVRARVDLADALRKGNRPIEAAEVLSAISQRALIRLKSHQQTTADLHRIEGLLLLANGEFDRARTALQQSLEIVTRRQGSNHWRTERARAELARVTH